MMMHDVLDDIDREAVSEWFELSYSSYLVLPRVCMEYMPGDWQARFVALLREMEEVFESTPNYDVRIRDGKGRWVEDPLRNYRRPDTAALAAILVKRGGG